ncbi:wax ester/triacylglycerol synthase domain-containing protein [Kitasatospora sp. GP82]|uniref:WS/DGAT domain-containing protein n=1 Tax=Kitasatospora sp. GP82 TaxID=3035089 RepID=UPI00247419A3|nr:wax ester/triacylglycerol synthase domain-containing protein [Kitasatospora sp. GP82]MDH6128330.1 diacylglycerol O-acyltransferase [Kitasatospora sp. GP82]
MTVRLRPTPMDLTMHRMAQIQPSISQTIGAFLHLDGAAPPLDELRGHLASHLDHEPRLTHYLHGPGLKAHWAHDPTPDLETRVRERRLQPGDDHLHAALQDLVKHPLPDQGPLWDMWLLHGHAPNRYVICYRAHHSTQDGGGFLNTLHHLFGTAPTLPTTGPAPTAKIGAYASTLRATLDACAVNNVWNDPKRPLTGARITNWADIPTDHLRTTAANRGGSTNDAFLAALTGALRTWSSVHWPQGANRPLPAVAMVDLRRTEEADLPGNHCSFIPVPLPCHQPNPASHLEEITAITRGAKNPARRHAMRVLMDLTPARPFSALATRLTTPARAVITTSCVAIRQPLSHQGNPVSHVQVFNWLPHNQPASVIACSYNDTTSVCFVTDASLPELHQLPALWSQAAAKLCHPNREDV